MERMGDDMGSGSTGGAASARTGGTAELSGLTKAGLWYIYSASPVFWVRVARSFGVRVEPADWHPSALRAADDSAARAVRFVPVPLVTIATMLVLTSVWRPAFGGFLNTFSEKGFIALVRSAPMQAFGHRAAESGAVTLIALAIWVLSLASVLLSFAPVWLAFRYQMRVAAPVVALALASDPSGPATAHAAPADCVRLRHALGMLEKHATTSRVPRRRRM